jgi:hypothetical protein
MPNPISQIEIIPNLDDLPFNPKSAISNPQSKQSPIESIANPQSQIPNPKSPTYLLDSFWDTE